MASGSVRHAAKERVHATCAGSHRAHHGFTYRANPSRPGVNPSEPGVNPSGSGVYPSGSGVYPVYTPCRQPRPRRTRTCPARRYFRARTAQSGAARTGKRVRQKTARNQWQKPDGAAGHGKSGIPEILSGMPLYAGCLRRANIPYLAVAGLMPSLRITSLVMSVLRVSLIYRPSVCGLERSTA